MGEGKIGGRKLGWRPVDPVDLSDEVDRFLDEKGDVEKPEVG